MPDSSDLSLRDRVAPWLPYWPWVVVPLLCIAIAVLASQNSAQAHKLELVAGDVDALEQQVATLKKARSAPAFAPTPFGLNPRASADLSTATHPLPTGPGPRRAEGRTRPGKASPASPAKAGKRGKRDQ